MNVFIVEDDQWSAVTLQKLIADYFPGCKVLGTASNAEDALEALSKIRPDVLIADIEIDDKNIFEVLEQLEKKADMHIVLTTSHENYALEAFSYDVLDYIVKPVTLEKLVRTHNKVSKYHASLQSEDVKKLGKENSDENRMIGIASVDKIEVISVDSILYVQADGRYSHFHLLDGTQRVASKNIGEYEKILPKEDFLRVHHSYIVNMNYVKSVSKADGSFIELFRGKKTIPLSKRKQELLNKFLKIKF
jgi:two-component system LytT family response regulator